MGSSHEKTPRGNMALPRVDGLRKTKPLPSRRTLTVGVISRGTIVRQRFEANPIAYQNCSIDATKVNHAQGAVVPRAGDDRVGGVPCRQVLSGVPTRFLFLLMTAGRGCSQPLPSHSKMRLGGWLARPEISFCRSQLRVSPRAISGMVQNARHSGNSSGPLDWSGVLQRL